MIWVFATRLQELQVCHKNIPNMIGQLTSVVAAEGINVSDMVDKSKGDYAYAIIDCDDPATEQLVSKLQAVEGVIKVRVIK